MTLAVRPHPDPGRSAPHGAEGDPGAAGPGPGSSGIPGASPGPLRSRTSPQRRRRRRRDAMLFGALIAPNLIAIIVFSYYPALYNIGLSVMEWDFVAPSPEFVGLENYIDLLTDPSFGQVLLNTLVFTGVSVVGSIIGGLLLGSLLATKVPLTGFAQTMAFAPHMLPGAAVGILWLFMFDPNYGLSRWVFSLFGAASPDWTTTSDWSLWAITIAYTWQRLGFVTVICYTAILDLPKDLYEAAALDGAHGGKLLRHLTLPLLSPIIFFLSITGIISAAQAFDIISIMTSGGPGVSSSTLSWMVYEEAFQKFDIGTASAAATVLLAILLVITYLQVRVGDRKVNYDS
ncbi:carbohydrate ABC transporter permease [Brachybacterium fresconis]|uniref:Sn-glycerol 3-phosphate transport system permease protein n=1 Tax=Brachybacterium fresconis TaxID=173363 RepID=A0ABS4YLM8_9MICO|nr:sugar ABC transporter permease [Brachybacterium fresconis]MBP2409400.1 sn-glycerol 3-phosphate transport system permease protein [Brachybacterium fresconis]